MKIITAFAIVAAAFSFNANARIVTANDYSIHANQIARAMYCKNAGAISESVMQSHIDDAIRLIKRPHRKTKEVPYVDMDRLFDGAKNRLKVFEDTYGRNNPNRMSCGLMN